MSDILIIARTRMQHGNICVGAIEMETGRMIRPLTSRGQNFIEAAPWTVGDVWRVTFVPKYRLTPPHIEDVCVTGMIRIGRIDDIGEWFRHTPHASRVFAGPAEALFDGTLTFEPFDLRDERRNPHTALLERRERLPGMSLQLWQTDRLLIRHETREHGRHTVRYNGFCPPGSTVSFRMKHVGYTPQPLVIPVGSLISLSLARWWAKPDRYRGREACYLQLCDVLAMPNEDDVPLRGIEEEPAIW